MTGGGNGSQNNGLTWERALALVSFVGLVLTSYFNFRHDDGERVNDLTRTVVLLEYRVTQIERSRE